MQNDKFSHQFSQFEPSFFEILSPRRWYFHVNTSKRSERWEAEMITLLQGECYSSHLLFTCFLVLSLTLCLFFPLPRSFRFGVSVKRRRCDHSAISALVETNLICAQNRQLFKFLPSQMPITFSFHKKNSQFVKAIKLHWSYFNRSARFEILRKKTRKPEFDEYRPISPLGDDLSGKKIYKNTLACFGIRC